MMLSESLCALEEAAAERPVGAALLLRRPALFGTRSLAGFLAAAGAFVAAFFLPTTALDVLLSAAFVALAGA